MNITTIMAEKALCATGIDLADFVINPYRGCQFGCSYCYARSNKGLKKIQEEWGSFVQVKENLPHLLEKELADTNMHANLRRVLIGSTTEPFQQAENEYHITRDIISILKRKNIPLVILTKSSDVAQFARDLCYSQKNKIYITVNTGIVRDLFEKSSPPQAERITAIEKMHQNGIDTIAYVSPVFPIFTDVENIFESLRGKTKKIYFEAYNPRLGNFDDVKLKLDEETLGEYQKIFFDPFNYEQYWKDFIEKTNRLNEQYNFNIEIFIYPFNSYYSSQRL